MNDDISTALKSKDPERQIAGAQKAGSLGFRGIRHVEELVKMLIGSNNELVRFEVADALQSISWHGLGPVTVQVVPQLISLLEDPLQPTYLKVMVATTLSNCIYDVFPNRTEILEQVEHAIMGIKPTDSLEISILLDAIEKIDALLDS